MNKLEEIHLNLIERNGWGQTEYDGLHTFENEKSFTEINGEIVAQKSAEITTDVTVKFVEWLEKERYIKFAIFENQMSSTHYKYERWDKSYKNSFEIDESETKTTEELFEIFINNHYGK
jgi:hypothetical protein